MMKYFKKLTYFFTILLLIQSCIQKGYFKTPNDVYQTEAIITLVSGEIMTGKITILFESELRQEDYLLFNSNNKSEKIYLTNIAKYQIKNNTYFPKFVILPGSENSSILFLKLLNNENSRLQIFELYLQRNLNTNEVERFFYFVASKAQSRLEALSLTKKELVPNFEIKMANVVRDCPTLAGLIANRTNGYFVPSITFSYLKTLQTLRNIAAAYDSCK